jgi:hypothetical protein
VIKHNFNKAMTILFTSRDKFVVSLPILLEKLSFHIFIIVSEIEKLERQKSNILLEKKKEKSILCFYTVYIYI